MVTPATRRGTSALLSPSEEVPCFRRETSPAPASDDALLDMTPRMVEVSARNPSPPRRAENREEG